MRRAPVYAGVATATAALLVASVAFTLRSDDEASLVRAGGAPPTTVPDETTTSTRDAPTTTTVVLSPVTNSTASTTTTARHTTTTTSPPALSGRLPMLTPMDIAAAPDGRTAWVVGSSGGAGVFARTADGGRTWRWTCLDRLVTAVVMLDARRGMVFAGRAGDLPAMVYTTTDGGDTFAPRPLGAPISTIKAAGFSDERTGTIVGSIRGASGEAAGVAISTTNDWETYEVLHRPGMELEDLVGAPGGPTFAVGSRNQLPPVLVAGDGTQVELPEVAQLRDGVHVDGVLVVVGASKPTPDGALEGPSMVRSVDGGATWAAIATSPVANLHAVTTSPTGELWAVGQDERFAPVVMVSADRGDTWQVRHASPAGGAYTAVAAGGTAVWALSHQPGLAVVADTADPSAVWAEQRPGPTPSC